MTTDDKRALLMAFAMLLSACQPRPDVELERARANFAEVTRGLFSEDCNRVSVDVRRRRDKSLEGVVVWKSPTPSTFTAVYRADSDAGWKCDVIQSSSSGACELLKVCGAVNETKAETKRIEAKTDRMKKALEGIQKYPRLGDIRIEVPPRSPK